MLNRIAIGVLILSTTGYILSIIKADVFMYIFALVILCAAFAFTLMVFATNVMWKYLQSVLKARYGISKKRFYTITILSPLFFLVMVRTINKNYLSDSISIVNFSCNIGIFIFAFFMAWSLIKKSKWRTILIECGIFILFISGCSFASSLNFRVTKEDSSLKNLGTLGYVNWVDIETKDETEEIKSGVITHDVELAFPGLNLYVSSGEPKAFLIDMKGDVVHQWGSNIKGGDEWIYAEMCPNGDLLVVADDQMLIRLDWDSNIKWKKEIHAHHDVSLDKNGNVYALGREDALVFWHGVPLPILSDYILVLSPDGQTKTKTSLYELLGNKLVFFYKENNWNISLDFDIRQP